MWGVTKRSCKFHGSNGTLKPTSREKIKRLKQQKAKWKAEREQRKKFIKNKESIQEDNTISLLARNIIKIAV